MTDFGFTGLTAILAAGAVLLAAVIGYWKIRRAKSPEQMPPQIDQSRRTLLAAGQDLKKPEPPVSNVEEWKPARDAVEAYADPELLSSRDFWVGKCDFAVEKEAEAQRQIQEIRDRFPNGEVPSDSDARKDLEQAERQHRMKALVLVNSQEEVRQLRLDIHSDVYKKLCVGTLLAKGFREPRAEATPEVLIPPAEWRSLMLYHVDARAVERGVDGKLVYSGLVIGKPKG